MNDILSGSNLTATNQGINLGPGTQTTSAPPPAPAQGRPLDERIAYGLEGFGAGMRGQPSMMEREIASARKDKAMKFEEFKVKANMFESGIKALKGQTGDARTRAVDFWAAQIGTLSPEWAEGFKTMAGDQPGMDRLFLRNADRSTTWTAAMAADGNKGEIAMQLYNTDSKFREQVAKEWKTADLGQIQKKVQALNSKLEQLLPPDMVARFKENGVISTPELLEANSYVSNHPDPAMRAMALDDLQMGIVNETGDAAFIGVPNFISAKTEQEVMQARMTEKQEKVDYNKPFLPDGTPNLAYQDYATKKARSGAAPRQESNLRRLFDEMNALPQGDPMREAYKNKIRKETETAKQISPTGGLNPAKVEEQNAQMDAVEKQIDELKAIISKSRSVGPLGFLNRAAETVRGVIPGMEDASTPALTTQSKKELIIANVRKLIAGGGVFSNQDARRLDDALSMGLMSTPGSAQQGLDDLKAFLREKRQQMPSQAQSGSKPKAEDFFRD